MDRISEPGQETSAETSGENDEQSLQLPLPAPEDPEYWLADSLEVPAESADPELRAENVDPKGAGWFKGTIGGAAIAFAAVLLGLVLLHIRIATEGGRADPGLLSPSEFWTSVEGLLVTWFPMAWVLGGLGIGLAAVAYLVNRRARPVSRPRLAGGLAVFAALLIAGVAYQQFLRQVTLSLDQAEIGVAVSRQMQITDARAELSKYLAQVGQGGKALVRPLPVSLDASQTGRARELAKSIGADVVVIFDEGDTEAISATASKPSLQTSQRQFVAHIALADPGAGSEIPVPQRSADGVVDSVEFRAKASVEAPRIQMSSWDRLLEATAGIVMYERDRYLPAITHLRNAVSPDRSDRSDALILYYLGSAQLLAGEEEQARQSLDEAIAVFDGRPTLTIEEHLLLAHTYAARASVHLYARELDQAGVLLQKAAELRGPVDKDRSALDHPSDLRRFHETFGTVYLQLMDLASRREDPGGEEAWRSRARGEANALLKGDGLARSAGIWLLYRTGGCEQAYRLLTDDLAEDPDDLRARRAIAQLAALRTGLGTLESDQQLDELLRRNPHSVQDHQRKLVGSAFKAAVEDAVVTEDQRMTLDRLLELDPVYLPALEELVTSTEAYSRLYLNSSSAGHAPTYRTLQRGLLGDPQHASDVVDYIETARSPLKRWAELQPDSAAPLVAQLRVSFATETWLYNQIHVVPVSDPSRQPDARMAELYERVWRAAVEEGESLLGSTKHKTNSDLIRTRVVLGEIWLHRYFATLTGDPAAADEAITRASAHMESAAELAPQLGTFIDEVNLASRSYISMFTVFATASPHYESKGESSTAERMDRLGSQALSWIEATSALSRADAEKRRQQLSLRTCKSGDFMRAGRELLSRGEYRPAIQVLRDYVALYPQDPEGHRELGWAHFKNRTLDRARESMEKYQALVPDDPQAASKLGVVYLAEGRERQGAEQIDRSLKLIDKEPLGLRLQQLSLISSDLLEVASEHERSHPAIAKAVSRIRDHVAALPPKARTLEGSRLVQVLSAAGAAAAWAGETTSAQALLNEGLEINADHVLLRSTLGFAKLEGGDPAGARIDYEKAVASGSRYLQDWAGRPLGSADLEQARQLLKQELEASAAALDVLGDRVDGVNAAAVELAAMLRSAAASA